VLLRSAEARLTLLGPVASSLLAHSVAMLISVCVWAGAGGALEASPQPMRVIWGRCRPWSGCQEGVWLESAAP